RMVSGIRRMNVSSLIPVRANAGLEVSWDDGERVICRGRYPDTQGGLHNVLFVTPSAEHPTVVDLDRLDHEYALRGESDEAWAVRPLALLREHGRTVLVLEDPGSQPIEQLLGVPMEPGRFLRLAIAVTAALAQLHRRGLIHKDLKPANILID